MSPDSNNLGGRPGSLVESRGGRDPRVTFFYWLVALLLLYLVCGLAYQQLFNARTHHATERHQDQRRVVTPGPRGNIYDRNGRLLVSNRPRFAVVLYLDELADEFRREFIRVRNNYRETGDRDLPNAAQMEQIARFSVVQRYLDQVNAILGTDHKVSAPALRSHFEHELLLPFPLLDDLSQEDFAALVERLPVRSPLEITYTNARYYPYGSAAAHTLGFVGPDEDVESASLPGSDLTTLKMTGMIGRDGLERRYDRRLQGEAGSTIFRVDPAGYVVHPPLEKRLPVQGGNLTTSLDIDLQVAAEQALGDYAGAAVALDVNTGEVLVLASKPDYNLNDFSPHPSAATIADIEQRGAWLNRAVNGLYPPGSTFKVVTTVAGLRVGAIDPDTSTATCTGSMMIGGRLFKCDNGDGDHGLLDLREAIAQSCDVFFYTYGLRTGVEAIAAQARRFHLDRPTGIDLPGETRHMIIPDIAWKRRVQNEDWYPGDTANMSIGQGFIRVTPLQMACLAASVARNESTTVPTLLHDPDRPRQHGEPLGLTPRQRSALVDGMEGCTTDPKGTAHILTTVQDLVVPGVRIAGKTGTATVSLGAGKGYIDIAWFICFAPIENPRIAVAVAVQGDTPDETFGGGTYASRVASVVLQKYFAKPGGPAALTSR
jgi:penicillin-binding protein 2